MEQKKIEMFRSRLRELQRVIENQLKFSGNHCGLTLKQMHIILEIGNRATVTLTELAKILKMFKSNLSRSVEELVKQDYIKRTTHPGDRRYTVITLTEKGITRYQEINDLCNDIYVDIFQEMGEPRFDEMFRGLHLLIYSLKKFGLKIEEHEAGHKEAGAK